MKHIHKCSNKIFLVSYYTITLAPVRIAWNLWKERNGRNLKADPTLFKRSNGIVLVPYVFRVKSIV